MFRLPRVCAVVLLIAATASAASRITFERTIPAHHSLGAAQDLVITYAIGDNDKISTFIDVFMDQANRSEILHVLDPTVFERSTERHHRWRRPPKYVEQRYRADIYLRIDAFSCQTYERSGLIGSYDVDGNRVRTTQRWVDATCQAHINALGKDSKTKITEFGVRGEGTSGRAAEVTDEDRDVAVDQAARYAAVAAAEEITPRRVRETIALIEEAPEFARGMDLIELDQLAEARRLWESLLPTYHSSAPLQFNLGAVCEALGDLRAATDHYQEAQRLAPAASRYRYELDMFRHRYGLKNEEPSKTRPRKRVSS